MSLKSIFYLVSMIYLMFFTNYCKKQVESSKNHVNLLIDKTEESDDNIEKLTSPETPDVKEPENSNDITLPEWAVKLGLTLPEGLDYNSSLSHSTSEENASEGYNSLNLVFTGDYEKVLEQAGIMADIAKIPMSKDFIDAKKIQLKNFETARKSGNVIPEIKGMIYSNFNLENISKPEYLISIIVDENAMLTINAVNHEQLNEISARTVIK